jgi:hypothetical protein
MSLRVLGLAFGALVLLGAAEPASTCIFVPQPVHRVDPALEASDHEPPPPPVVVAVDAFRRNGMTCTQTSCVQNSCGDTGTVRIELAPSADDQTPPDQLGYRLVLVRGALPPSLSSIIGVTLAGGHPLFLRPGFDELPALDVALAAVAVDAAGNESQPSAPFSVRFDGCTLAAVGDRCEDELEPDADLSAAFEEQLAKGLDDSESPVAGAAGCAVGAARAGSPPNGTWLALLAAASWAGLAFRRRAQRRTTYPQSCE